MAPCAAALLPLLVYVFTAPGHGYWLDSPEFTAAAVQLDIPHPPGHPLFALWSKPFTWLPIGPLPYRVALGQAVACALALASVQLAITRSLARLGVADAWTRALLSVAAVWVLAGSYGVWFQSTRAEVYALEAMLVCFALERLTLLACSEQSDPRPFYLACLALGLGLANHHFIAVLALPSLGYALLPLWRAHGVRVPLTATLTGALGLVCYLYLPLRAAATPPMDLGHPVTWSDFFWVVSAQVYARHIGQAALQPLGERFADLVVILVENFSFVVLPLALLGGYALLRSRRCWPLAYLWLSTVLISLCGRAYLNPVRGNPDVLGYMMPGFAALLALAALGVGALLTSLPERSHRTPLALVVAGLALLLGPAQLLREAPRSSLRSFHVTDEMDELRRRALPTRSLLVLVTPDVVFRHWEGEAVEQLRSDVVMLPLPFVGYGASEQVWARRHPELAPLMADFQKHGQLSVQQLRLLARERPVYVELDTTTSYALLPYTVPDGLLYRVLPGPATQTEIVAAGVDRQRLQTRLLARSAGDLTDLETRRHLTWVRYVEALYFAWHQAFGLSRESADAGLALSPEARELKQLRAALAGSAPLDLTPYRVVRRSGETR